MPLQCAEHTLPSLYLRCLFFLFNLFIYQREKHVPLHAYRHQRTVCEKSILSYQVKSRNPTQAASLRGWPLHKHTVLQACIWTDATNSPTHTKWRRLFFSFLAFIGWGWLLGQRWVLYVLPLSALEPRLVPLSAACTCCHSPCVFSRTQSCCIQKVLFLWLSSILHLSKDHQHQHHVRGCYRCTIPTSAPYAIKCPR